MSVRLAFAVAAHLEPEILLIDEVLAVGDAEFQQRCLGRMEDMSNSGRTIVFVSHQMQAVAQLCDRAILLEKGGVVLDGPSGDVVAQYLQSVGGSSSTQFWPDLDSAPGDSLVRLRSVRVVDSDGAVTDAVDVRDSVGIEIAYTVLRNDGPAVFPKIKLYDARRNVIFNALDTSARWLEPAATGDYVSTAWIPRQSPERGTDHGRRRRLLDRHAQAAPAHRCERRGLVPRPGSGRGRLCEGSIRRTGSGGCAPAPRMDNSRGLTVCEHDR